MTMRKIALTTAGAFALAACNPQQIHRACTTVIGSAQTAQDLWPILVRVFNVPADKAKTWADQLVRGKATASGICAFVDPPAPVAAP